MLVPCWESAGHPFYFNTGLVRLETILFVSLLCSRVTVASTRRHHLGADSCVELFASTLRCLFHHLQATQALSKMFRQWTSCLDLPMNFDSNKMSFSFCGDYSMRLQQCLMPMLQAIFRNRISSTKRNMTILLAKCTTVRQPLRVQRMIMKMAKFPTQGQKTILRRQILTSIQNFEGEQIHNI